MGVFDNILIRASIFILFLGLAIGLPSLESFFIDFTQLSEEGITFIRIALVLFGFGFFVGGDL